MVVICELSLPAIPHGAERFRFVTCHAVSAASRGCYDNMMFAAYAARPFDVEQLHSL